MPSLRVTDALTPSYVIKKEAPLRCHLMDQLCPVVANNPRSHDHQFTSALDC